MSAYDVRRLDEFEAVPISSEGITWRPVRRTLGIRAFGMNAYTAEEPGQRVVEDHTESGLGHEEVYVVVAGRARFTLGEDEVEAGAGTLVYVRDPGTRRGAVALEAATSVLAVGGKPGEAYEPSAWEWWFAASPHRDGADYATALAIVREGLEQKPDHPALLYNVACYEALAGQREAALVHLRRAIDLDPRCLEWARDDDDFASLRDEPEFLAVAGEADAGGPGA